MVLNQKMATVFWLTLGTQYSYIYIATYEGDKPT